MKSKLVNYDSDSESDAHKKEEEKSKLKESNAVRKIDYSQLPIANPIKLPKSLATKERSQPPHPGNRAGERGEDDGEGEGDAWMPTKIDLSQQKSQEEQSDAASKSKSTSSNVMRLSRPVAGSSGMGN